MMYAKRIIFDDWKDLANIQKFIKYPTWEEVENVINMLDRKMHVFLPRLYIS